MTDDGFRYAKEDHAAARTDDYVFHQLIPYIGNKRKLLPLIRDAIARTGVSPPATFLDLFAGSGVVSRMAKRIGYRVVANDWEPYAEAINRCAVECNAPPPFRALGGYAAAIDALNALPPSVGWVTRHLCPSDDENVDPARDRQFFTRANGQRIDAVRARIAEWTDAGVIDRREEASLLAPALYQTCYTSNTSGVFKGFHNGWGGQTGTALYRIRSQFTLKPAVFHDNGCRNEVHRLDAQDLAEQLAAASAPVGIAYLDPPYNQHPYGSNYHVLNTVALNDAPPLTEKIHGKNKAAIREDWRTERRSAYNYRADAEAAFRRLLQSLDARFVLVSYSTEGIVPAAALLDACASRGDTTVLARGYKRYRVSSQRFSTKPLTVEFVAVVDTRRPHAGASAADLAAQIERVESRAIAVHGRA